jgi:hypothetical protein
MKVNSNINLTTDELFISKRAFISFFTEMATANWTPRASATEANTWNSVTYGNGLFVAVAYGGTNRVMTSPDGITWTPRTTTGTNDTNWWALVTYGNGLFVAVAGSGTNRVMTFSYDEKYYISGDSEGVLEQVPITYPKTYDEIKKGYYLTNSKKLLLQFSKQKFSPMKVNASTATYVENLLVKNRDLIRNRDSIRKRILKSWKTKK